MKIVLEHISKRFQRYWIFKDINYTFNKTDAVALLGPNGSGKSTLLRIIAGMQSPSLGKIRFCDNNDEVIADEKVFNNISFCAPGQELVEELTLREFFDFHFSFKRPLPGLSIDKIIQLSGLNDAADKPIGDYSSGMKQRLKLAQCILSDTPAIFLDEPCTNLDNEGISLYQQLISDYGKGRLIFVSSNVEVEYSFCKVKINITDYK